MKKLMAILLAALLVLSLAACGGTTENAGTGENDPANEDANTQTTGFDASHGITVMSREDGSGTRGAFIELMGIEQKNDAGEKVDMTTVDAEITNSTAVMMTSVAGDPYSIGYISLGSLDDTVKALEIDGVAASVDNIKNDSYKVARPFNIATNGEVSEAAQDFINYILSAEGQEVIEDNGYISVGDAEAFASNNAEGKVVVSGSSSVTPVMEKLIEAYAALNPNVEIELQTSDSTTGMTNTIDGVCDIGMASRELKDSEIEAGLTGTVIAMDGIAVIVNKECPVNELTSEQVMQIFTGELTSWSELQ